MCVGMYDVHGHNRPRRHHTSYQNAYLHSNKNRLRRVWNIRNRLGSCVACCGILCRNWVLHNNIEEEEEDAIPEQVIALKSIHSTIISDLLQFYLFHSSVNFMVIALMYIMMPCFYVIDPRPD